MNATSCILDDPEIRGAALPLTVAQYHHLSAQGIVPERTELLQGVIIECLTKSPLHTFLVQRLARWLEPAVTAARFLRKEEPLTLANSEPEPDIAVVSGCPEDYRTAHPATAAFVVEVAIATLGIDRAKAAVYAAADIPEYWIVIPEAQTVEIFRSPSSSGYGTRLILATADALVQPEGFAVPPLSIGQLFS